MNEIDLSDPLVNWLSYANNITDWEALVKGLQPEVGGCGLVYELPHPFAGKSKPVYKTPAESFAIADMRDLELSEPHSHRNETEIYVVLKGAGRIAVGSEIIPLFSGAGVIIPENMIHVTKPDKRSGLVLAVINSPPFKSSNYVPASPDNPHLNEVLAKLAA